MEDMVTTLPELSQLIERRLALLRKLAASLEGSTQALTKNDAEAIARGAAHQAELCRQWSHLEEALRGASARRGTAQNGAAQANTAHTDGLGHSAEAEHSARLQAEWETLGARIRYLTRVHWSLLRHLERSLAILSRVVDGCATTYTPDPAMLRAEVRLRAGE